MTMLVTGAAGLLGGRRPSCSSPWHPATGAGSPALRRGLAGAAGADGYAADIGDRAAIEAALSE